MKSQFSNETNPNERGSRVAIARKADHSATKPSGVQDLRHQNLIHKRVLLSTLFSLTACPIRPRPQMLSPRQNETLDHLLTGKSEKEIGKALTLSTETVHVYVKAVYKLLEVSSRAELMAQFITPGADLILARWLRDHSDQLADG